MNTSAESLYREIGDAFISAIEKANATPLTILSDMYVCLNMEDEQPTITLFDDLENVLHQAPFTHAMQHDEMESEQAEIHLVNGLKKVLESEPVKSQLETLNTTTPFSVILVDSEMGQITELLTLDSENIFLGDDFFSKADKELNLFFEELMKDFE